MSEEDQDALNVLWRKLVKLFHPDRFASEPEKKSVFERLTAAINQARDEGDIELLREIADDPDGFMLRQGWGALNLTEEVEVKALHKLYASLQLEIVNLLEMLNRLHESPEYELLTLSQKNPQLVEDVAEQQRNYWLRVSLLAVLQRLTNVGYQAARTPGGFATFHNISAIKNLMLIVLHCPVGIVAMHPTRIVEGVRINRLN